MSSKPLVYLMGPYTKGGQAANVRKAVEMADVICALGGCPFIPHLCHLWELIYPHNYDFWLEYDLNWLKVCDAAYRLPGESAGADEERKQCERLKIPVFYTTPTLMEFIENWRSSHGYYEA